MAEGWAHHLKSDVLEPYSAGIEAHGQNPSAVAVMSEVGVDITGQPSQRLEDLGPIEFDVVVTVCGHAHEHCPIFRGDARLVHVGFEDPPKLAAEAATEQEKMDCYRRVRDEIRTFVSQLPEAVSP